MRAEIIKLAQRAGQEILRYYHREEAYAVESKTDDTPVTCADLASNRIILEALRQLTPDIPVLSEEAEVPYEDRRHWRRFWLVDPLDGTKSFIRREDDFAVNIALVEDNVPVLGVIHAPVPDECYSAQQGEGAFLNGHRIFNHSTRADWIAAISFTNTTGRTQAFLDRHGIRDARRIGSALKFGRLATGEVDLYPRYAPCKEWDVAAGHAILLEAGCKLLELETGRPPVYNKENLHQPPFVASRADIDLFSGAAHP